MDIMKRYATKLLFLTAAIVLLLTGCFFQSPDELYAPPRAPDDYLKLQSKIDEVLGRGGEYAAPISGELTQQVQLQDLDGDGVKEAIAFFRVSTDEKPLKIYIYRQVGEDYEVAAIIEEAGSGINSVYYENVDDSPTKEIIVSWQMSDKVHSLAAYSINGFQVLELMRTSYTDFQIYDLDMDGQQEILAIQSGTAESAGRVELYNFHGGVLDLESSAPLSLGTMGLVEGGVKTGYLQELVPALFVPSQYGENGQITDVFAWRNNRIENITLDAETGESDNTIRWYTQVSGTDINNDLIMELPDPYALPDPKSATTAVNFWAIRWRQYDIDGKQWPVFTTYHNDRDGWYFILPDEWEGKIILSRSDLSGGSERAVVFSYWEEGSLAEPVPFLVIYKLTGSNREMRAALTGRFRLMSEEEAGDATIYAARLLTDGWDCGLDEEGVRENFALITSG